MNETLSVTKYRDISSIKKYCLAHSGEFAYSFDGIIEFLKCLSFIDIVGQKIKLSTIGELFKNELKEENNFRTKIFFALINKLIKENALQEFLNIEVIKFDITHKSITIPNSSIPLSFSGIKNFCIKTNIFFIANNRAVLVLNQDLFNYYKSEIFPYLNNKVFETVENYKITIDDFLLIQQKKQYYGQEAEQIVLAFEKQRLTSHPLLDDIQIISNIDISAGYDILSFNSLSSHNIDRFIEVKSYKGKPSFYWSRNEINTAIKKGDKYFLYLVNRDSAKEINSESIIIIQNPYKEIFEFDNWLKEPHNWFITA